MNASHKSDTSPFAARTVAILLTVAIVSFGAIMVLAGWSPELADRNKAGDHPFSTSALGYNGYVQLLEDQGYPVEVSRLKRNLDRRDWGVMIVTLTPWRMFKALDELTVQETTLFVMPKWVGRVDQMNQKRQADTYFQDASVLNDLLREIDIDGTIARVDVPKRTVTPFGNVALKPDLKMQLIVSDTLEPIVGTDEGILLGRLPGTNNYILTDPDMINTFGLAQRENARFAVQMIDYLRSDEFEPILLDATLHGFERSENLLQMIFDVPFIGATLTALASVFLLGWAALVRFGPPNREGRAIALGKQALADNSAGLVTMARRETRMAPGYLNLIRKRTAREIGAPKTLNEAQLAALFDRLGPDETNGKTFSQIAAGLQGPAANREDLMTKARDLFRWHRDIIGRSGK